MIHIQRRSARIIALALLFACTSCELWRQRTPDNTVLLENISQEWFCYSDSTGNDWDCGRQQKEPTVVAVSRDPDESATSRFILSQSPTAYAVQLLGHWDRGQIAEYAASVGLKAPYIQVRVSDKEVEWYVLLLGVYPDESTALRTMERWVNEVNPDVAPSLIEIASLQRTIRAGEG